MNSCPDTGVNNKAGGPFIVLSEAPRHLLKTRGGANKHLSLVWAGRRAQVGKRDREHGGFSGRGWEDDDKRSFRRRREICEESEGEGRTPGVVGGKEMKARA